MIYTAALVLAQAASPSRCDERAILTAWLKERFGESHQVTLVQTQNLIEIWVNRETQTWTLVATNAAGISCMHASGAGVLVGGSEPSDDKY